MKRTFLPFSDELAALALDEVVAAADAVELAELLFVLLLLPHAATSRAAATRALRVPNLNLRILSPRKGFEKIIRHLMTLCK
jgi:hypothetical protein